MTNTKANPYSSPKVLNLSNAAGKGRLERVRKVIEALSVDVRQEVWGSGVYALRALYQLKG